MAIRRGRGVAAVNYPTGMNLGGDPSQALVHATHDRQLHRHAVLGRSRPGPEARSMAQICAETIGVPTEHGHHRHRRHRHRPALHGHLRQPRHAPHRQRRHQAAQEARAGDAGSRGRGAGGRRRRPRDRRQGQHPRQGRAAEVDLDLRHRARRPFQARPDRSPAAACSCMPRSYPGARDRRDEAGDLLRPCLHGRRGRGRRRDRRGRPSCR